MVEVISAGVLRTQEIIENHLLKVGSSRYQNLDFRKKHPSFSAISRFGIGVLSCFMIADDVEIHTIHPEEEQGRHLSLRTVHGRYLIRLLNKQSDPTLVSVGQHGTKITLKIRHSVKEVDILKNARRWIVFPGCDVVTRIDDEEPIHIGYKSPKEALNHALTQLGYNVVENPSDQDMKSADETNPAVKIIEESNESLTLAYAVMWSKYFKEWSFLNIESRLRYAVEENSRIAPILGTCIEGIRVESGTPGFNSMSIAAIANAFGPNAPKTNVARSNLEATTERNQMLRQIYAIYAMHVDAELSDLHKQRSFSLTWATQESSFLLSTLTNQAEARAQNVGLLITELEKLPVLLVEGNGQKRHAISPAKLTASETFWTSDSELFKSAERLLREVPTSTSLNAIVGTLGEGDVKLPDGLLLSTSSYTSSLHKSAFKNKEVEEIRIIRDQRRVDLLWRNVSLERSWLNLNPTKVEAGYRRFRQIEDTLRRRTVGGIGVFDIYIAKNNVPMTGFEDEMAVLSQGKIFVLQRGEAASYLLNFLERLDLRTDEETQYAALAVFSQALSLLEGGYIDTDFSVDDLSDFFSRGFPKLKERDDVREFARIARSSTWKIFDPKVWSRNSPIQDEFLSDFVF